MPGDGGSDDDSVTGWGGGEDDTWGQPAGICWSARGDEGEAEQASGGSAAEESDGSAASAASGAESDSEDSSSAAEEEEEEEEEAPWWSTGSGLIARMDDAAQAERFAHRAAVGEWGTTAEMLRSLEWHEFGQGPTEGPRRAATAGGGRRAHRRRPAEGRARLSAGGSAAYRPATALSIRDFENLTIPDVIGMADDVKVRTCTELMGRQDIRTPQRANEVLMQLVDARAKEREKAKRMQNWLDAVRAAELRQRAAAKEAEERAAAEGEGERDAPAKPHLPPAPAADVQARPATADGLVESCTDLVRSKEQESIAARWATSEMPAPAPFATKELAAACAQSVDAAIALCDATVGSPEPALCRAVRDRYLLEQAEREQAVRAAKEAAREAAKEAAREAKEQSETRKALLARTPIHDPSNWDHRIDCCSELGPILGFHRRRRRPIGCLRPFICL